MKNLFIIIASLTVVFILVGAGIYFSPKIIYYKIVNCEYSPFWYQVDDCKKRNYELTVYESLPAVKPLVEESRWKVFHIGDFKIALPFRNPLLEVIPEVIYDEYLGKTNIILKIMNRGQQELIKINFNEDVVLKKKFDRQKIFISPYVFNFLVQIPERKIWEDIFTLQLETKFEEIMNLSFNDLLYRLYIWDFRDYLFSKLEIKKSTYYKDVQMAVGEISDDGRSKSEKIIYLNTGVLETYSLKTDLFYPMSSDIRSFLLNKILFEKGVSEMSAEIYKEFQNLPYEDKIDQEGMLYLLSAFSHKLDDKGFLEDIIYYLERGKENFSKLQFFYSYAQARYGNDFMDYTKKMRERLKEKIEEEEKAEDDAIKNTNIDDNINMKFPNHNERSKALLNQSRRKYKKKDKSLKFN